MVTSFSLLETMRLERGQIARLDRHLRRLAGSARHFGYHLDDERVRAALAECATAHPDGCWRVRLLVSSSGTPTIECTPHSDSGKPWRVAFAATAVDPGDPFLLNKTTNRSVYEQAKAARPDVDDVVLWNTRGEITESTIGNVVAEIGGVRYTPPVACGLLGGTFRAQLLDAGAIRERVLTKQDVIAASRLWLVNSVREWVDADLVS